MAKSRQVDCKQIASHILLDALGYSPMIRMPVALDALLRRLRKKWR